MGLETGMYISDLVATNPLAGDLRSEGDDHLRLIKAAIKATFPNLNGAVTGTPAQLNALLAGEAAELDVASAATVNLGGQTSRKLRVTGSIGITSFGTAYAGPIIVRFEEGLTITHNATTLLCPGGVNYVAAAGDVVIVTPKATVSGTADGWLVIAWLTLVAADARFAKLAGLSTQDFSAKTFRGSASGMPKFRVYRATSAQALTSGLQTKIQFNEEAFDTNSNFDSTTNFRFTPTVAGYYAVSWAITVQADSNTLTNCLTLLLKNGAGAQTSSGSGIVSTTNLTATQFVSVGRDVVYMNGSTDYLEVAVFAVGTSPTIQADANGTVSSFTGALMV